MTTHKALKTACKTFFELKNGIDENVVIDKKCRISFYSSSKETSSRMCDELVIFQNITNNSISIFEAWNSISDKIVYDYNLRDFLNINE